jgi:exopolyphosphatase / guanosine-5'-triphosphate,3'-diphosphate pyrophosphatase
LLHDVGAFVGYSNHQSHSYYLIRHSEMLGFNDEELQLMAALAFFHRRQLPGREHPEFAGMSAKLQSRVRVLCILLRIAESLDRSHAGLILSASLVPVGRKSLRLELTAASDCQLELWGVRKHRKAVEKTFGRVLVEACSVVPHRAVADA